MSMSVWMEATDVMRLPTVQTLMAHTLVNVIWVTQEMVTFVVVRSPKCSRSDEDDDIFFQFSHQFQLFVKILDPCTNGF